MVRDGFYYAIAAIFLGVAAAYFGGPAWAVPEWMLAAFFLYFFRDPERTAPAEDGVVSPADGRIVESREAELSGVRLWKISIFLSVFDVHVNRAPLAGVIREVRYQPGKFLIASRPEASVQNEQNTVAIAGERYVVIVKQIAGALARRIVFSKKVGDPVARGERIGLIKFGSRVDVFLPQDLRPVVAVGDRVKAGASLLARAAPASCAAQRNSSTDSELPASFPAALER
jgi:phosphatidylserine decarboxylase